MLTSSNYFVDYIDAVLLDERSSLTVDVIYQFLTTFFPKVEIFIKFVLKILTKVVFISGFCSRTF